MDHSSPVQHQISVDLEDRGYSFLERFKSKQFELRKKFKVFLKSQTYKFPINKNKIIMGIQKEQNMDNLLNIKKIRSQKRQLSSELNKHLNEMKFIDHRKLYKQKTFYSLQQKVNKVEQLRLERKVELKHLQRTMKTINEEIMKQKLRYKISIDQSKHNLEYSRVQCSRQKSEKASEVRYKKGMHQEMINKSKTKQIQHNKFRCKTVRQLQKRNANLSVSRIYLQKRNQADEVKIQKLFRELAEKQQLRINVSKLKRKRNQIRNSPYVQKNSSMDVQISNLRKNLCEDSFPVTRTKIKDRVKLGQKFNSYTEANDEHSTNTLFPFQTNSRFKKQRVSLFDD